GYKEKKPSPQDSKKEASGKSGSTWKFRRRRGGDGGDIYGTRARPRGRGSGGGGLDPLSPPPYDRAPRLHPPRWGGEGSHRPGLVLADRPGPVGDPGIVSNS